MQVSEKAIELIEFAKAQEPKWTGKARQDDPEKGWLHVTAERTHPEYGREKVELWWLGNAMKRPPEYTRLDHNPPTTIIEKNSAEIRRRLAGQPPKSKGRVKRSPEDPIRTAHKVATRAVRNGKHVNGVLPSPVPIADSIPARRIVRQQKLAFTPEDDDATILEALHGRKVTVASTIADDYPHVEHDVPRPSKVDGLAHAPRVVRLHDGIVNVDYVTAFGFRSLRVNNILRVR